MFSPILLMPQNHLHEKKHKMHNVVNPFLN
jgi:hypothetical protein